MNTSQFMDKQILDLMNHPPPKDQTSPKSNGQQSADSILPNYDFQPIRSVPSSSSSSPPSTTILIPPPAGSSSPPSTWTVSLDSRTDSRTGSSNLRSAGLTPEPPQVPTEPTGSCVSMSEIDRTVKKYVDTVLNALDGVNARLAQLENRTSHVETAVEGLRGILGDYNGSNEGKLRHFENILREVQAGVQVLRDKQEIVETQLHLSKFQPQNPPKPSSETQPQSPQAPQQQLALPAPPQIPAQSLPNAPPQYIPPPQMPLQSAPNAPPQAPPQYGPPSSQMGPQSGAPNAPPQYGPPPQMGPQSGAPNAPPAQYPPQMGPQSGAPSQIAPLQQPSYNQADPTHQPPNLAYHQPQSQQIGFQPQPPPSQYPPYQPDESNPNPYNQPPQTQTYPPRGNPNNPFIPQQQNLGPSPPSSSFYGPPPPQYDPYYSSGSPSYRSKPNSSSPFTPSNNPLPTAKVLPQANPQSSGSSNNGRVALDDVVEKVATMGFSREQVRATVKRLTENGQNVDLNVVLDKLMNDSDVIQPQKGWFNR